MSRVRGEEETSRLVRFYILILLTVICDQLTKILALHYLAAQDTLPIIPNIFHLTLVHNTGIAFGFFRDHQSLLFILISISLIILFVWGKTRKNLSAIDQVAVGLILGGAVGNWIDRLRLGAVIDFLDFRVWPVFNMADSAITVGVCLYLLSILKNKS